jgi:FkbM family methyltransferase
MKTRSKKIVLKDENKILKDIFSSNIKLFPRKIDKPVILYGAGSMGRMAKDFLDYLNIPFLFVIDKNAKEYRIDKFWKNTKIIHPNEVSEKDKKNSLLIICLVTSPLLDLHNELKKNKWRDVVFFYDVTEAYKNKYPINNGWFSGKFSEKEKKYVRRVLSSLADQASRFYYLRMLAWRRLRAELIFNDGQINNDNRFFIPEVINALNSNEVFVDCGAHKGSVTEKFLKIVKNKYKAVYAIEPDNASFKILEKKLGNTEKIKTIKFALSNKNSKEKFYDGFDFASKIDKKGKNLIKTAKLDSLNIEATFIKMHLEGGELNALKGATKTIKRQRPIVAVTLYHNQDGVWKIPLFLINNTKNYRYYMRMHSWAGTGAVFYAIPEEKNNLKTQ